MRVAVAPYWGGARPIMRDSGLSVLMAMLRDVRELLETTTDDKLIAYVLMPPDRVQDWDYDVYGDWVFPVRTGYNLSASMMTAASPFGFQRLLNCIDGQMRVDWIFTSSYAGALEAANVRERIGNWFDNYVPIVLYDLYDDLVGYIGPKSSVVGTLISASFRVCDLILITTEAVMHHRLSELEQFLNPLQVKHVQQRMLPPVGASDGDFSDENRAAMWAHRIAKPHVPVHLLWGSRLNTTKRWQIVLDWYQRYVDQGGRARISVTSPSLIGGAVANELRGICPRAHVYLDGLPYADWIDLCRSADFIVSASTGEGYVGSLAEAMAHGVLVMMPRRRWATAMFGVDYPLYYDHEYEVLAAFKLFEQEGIEPFREAFDYAFDTLPQHLARWMAAPGAIVDMMAAHTPRMGLMAGGQEQLSILRTVYDQMEDVFDFNDFVLALKSVLKSRLSSKGIMGRILLWYWLKVVGCTDVVSFSPMLKKPEEPNWQR